MEELGFPGLRQMGWSPPGKRSVMTELSHWRVLCVLRALRALCVCGVLCVRHVCVCCVCVWRVSVCV